MVLALTVFTFSENLHALRPSPIYLTLKSSPQDFKLFANGGFDGNWYVGYNSMWIAQFDVPVGTFTRVFVGAKLGRMKTKPVPAVDGEVRERKTVDCEIYAGLAPQAAWKNSDSYFLTNCEDIPLEGVRDMPLENVGEARWFWREVPLAALQVGKKNYLGVWSTTAEASDSGTAPIIAASQIEGSTQAWLNRSIQGAPPPDPQSALETQLSGYAPALAIKLITENSTDTVRVDLVSFQEAGDKLLCEVQVAANNFDRVRPEVSIDGTTWISFGGALFSPPFLVSIDRKQIEAEVSKI